MPFKPGQSGNPAGRPKAVEEFRLKARAIVDKHVLARWEQEVIEKGPYWMEASVLLVSYGYGKPSNVDSAAAPPPTIESGGQPTPEEWRLLNGMRKQLAEKAINEEPQDDGPH